MAIMLILTFQFIGQHLALPTKPRALHHKWYSHHRKCRKVFLAVDLNFQMNIARFRVCWLDFKNQSVVLVNANNRAIAHDACTIAF